MQSFPCSEKGKGKVPGTAPPAAPTAPCQGGAPPLPKLLGQDVRNPIQQPPARPGVREPQQAAGGAINARCEPSARRPRDAATLTPAAGLPDARVAAPGPVSSGQRRGGGTWGREGLPQRSRGPEDRKPPPSGGSCPAQPTLTGTPCLPSATNALGYLSGCHPRGPPMPPLAAPGHGTLYVPCELASPPGPPMAGPRAPVTCLAKPEPRGQPARAPGWHTSPASACWPWPLLGGAWGCAARPAAPEPSRAHLLLHLQLPALARSEEGRAGNKGCRGLGGQWGSPQPVLGPAHPASLHGCWGWLPRGGGEVRRRGPPAASPLQGGLPEGRGRSSWCPGPRPAGRGPGHSFMP